MNAILFHFKNKTIIFILSLVLFLSAVWEVTLSQNNQSQSDLYYKLRSLPDVVEIKPIQPDSIFSEAFEIFIEQPVDHQNKYGKKFKQKIFLSHKDYKSPMIFDTEGYNADYNVTQELTRILNGNQIVVEHRYFGDSKPDSIDWRYLNIKQAAADHHKIVSIFKNIYKGKWVSMGISKGGETTLFYRRYYPEDVDVSVPYVAPMVLAQEDRRVYSFLNNVGTEDCRSKIINFQREALKRRGSLFPMFLDYAKEKGYTYSKIGNEKAFEYEVLEYSFSFWQWAKSTCDDIPDSNSSNEKIFDNLIQVSSPDYLSDSSLVNIAPFYYQAYSEIGYYGYDITDFKDLLKVTKHATSQILVPDGSNPVYNCEVINDVISWLQKNGNNIIYIYGGNDTWSSCAMQLTGETNAIKMVKKGGSHKTRIKNFSGKEKEKIYSTLENWLGIKIKNIY